MPWPDRRIGASHESNGANRFRKFDPPVPEWDTPPAGGGRWARRPRSWCAGGWRWRFAGSRASGWRFLRSIWPAESRRTIWVSEAWMESASSSAGRLKGAPRLLRARSASSSRLCWRWRLWLVAEPAAAHGRRAVMSAIHHDVQTLVGQTGHDDPLFCPPLLSPSVFWNVRLSGVLRFDPWAAISYGQDLEPQGVSSWLSAFAQAL